jgi:hypothetical protein
MLCACGALSAVVVDSTHMNLTFQPNLLPPVSKFRGVFGGRKLFLPGHFGLIFDGRVETCFYCEVSYGPLVGCVIGGVTQGHRHSVAITTGAERQGFVTNRGRDWSVATPIPERLRQLSADTRRGGVAYDL